MAVFEMNRGLSVYSQGIQQIASLALLGLLAPFVYGQESVPPTPPPDNPLAAPFVKQLNTWMDSDSDHFLKEFRWTETPQRSWITRYRLYVPTHASSDHLVPLLVWMHRACEGGTDNKKHLVYLDELLFRDGQNPPECAILAVQSPTASWSQEESPLRDDPLSVVADIIDHVLKNHPVDVDRVLLSGVSTGGDACWYFACRYPDHIAAICPLGSQGGFLGEATNSTVLY